MKLLVTGAQGQLGSDLVRTTFSLGIPCVGAGRKEFDITDRKAVSEFISEYQPQAVIHCASYNAVDKAEDESELCRRVNEEGTANIAQACKAVRARMMYISTDYVFDGSGVTPYEVDAATNPLSVYGKTKAAGEQTVRAILKEYFIVRTSWLFGQNGNNFVKTMLNLSVTKNPISVVNDQIGSPTYTADLAPLLIDIVRSDRFGIYHATNEGFCSWAEFAREIMRFSGSGCRIKPVASSEYPTKAIRPKNSRLSKRSLTENGFPLLADWHSALASFLKDIQLM